MQRHSSRDLVIANVIVPLPVDTPYSYRVPEAFKEWLAPGFLVVVPFQNRYLPGIVLEVSPATDPAPVKGLKPIYDVIGEAPYLPPDLMQLLGWMADYYICHLGEAYRLVHLSQNLIKQPVEVCRRAEELPARLSAFNKKLLETLPLNEWVSVRKVEKQVGEKIPYHRLYALARQQWVEIRPVPPRARKPLKTEELFRLQPEQDWTPEFQQKYTRWLKSKRKPRALQLLELLQTEGELAGSKLKSLGFTARMLRELVAAGAVASREVPLEQSTPLVFQEELMDVQLTDEQQEFMNLVEPYLAGEQRFQPFLLHGITGSGKTQIYIELIKRVIAGGKQAIVLVPEIVLTPQTLARFYYHFQERVAAIHSRLSVGERLEILQKVRQGEYDVIIGPRSAIFAPFSRLGIIIVDEEHEASYKQSDAVPRYHARDVAIYRAYLNNIPIVLGSATPSFESLYNARYGSYKYYHLSRRISARNLPRTLVVDLKEEWRRTSEPPIFSDNLVLKLESRLLAREQAMILQNRRGFAPYILCKDCGYVARCPQCDITLTYHYQGHRLRCHYCGHQEKAPESCPNCAGLDILFQGIGTEKIEQWIREHFPHARLLRMDQDTTGRKHSHALILEKFRQGKADILIGTKMIAKGLDFERVTLVGVISADQGLHFPDFRSSEKVFQLLTQAAGRAGRGASSGEVVIQTFDPQHIIFKFLGTQDYLKFFERELESRKLLNYPPFARLCLIRIIGAAEEQVKAYAEKIAQFLWKHNPEKRFIIMGPSPAPLTRIRGQYRYHILIKQKREVDPSMVHLRRLLKQGLYKNARLKKWPVKIQIDVDPVEIL